MVAFIQNILAHIPSAGVLASGSVVLEIILRLVPSAKPMSILLAIKAGVHALGDLFSALAGALDAIIPQKLA